MIEIAYLREEKFLKTIPQEVQVNIKKILQVLDLEYGSNRDKFKDNGGYIFIPENIVDIEILKQDKLQGLIQEYTDLIVCSEGVNWTSSLFLLSSYFSIVVVTTEEFSKFLLE